MWGGYIWSLWFLHVDTGYNCQTLALFLLLIRSADDIAVDWVGNTLYWTDAVYARIEVLDLDTMERAQLFRTGTNTIPRAIVVDPGTRYTLLA